MVKARRPSRSKHDTVVAKESRQLEKEGWHVLADLPGFAQPDPIGTKNRVPDIVATKHGHTRIIEVETSESLAKDSEQQSTFRRSAAQRSNTIFKIVVAD